MGFLAGNYFGYFLIVATREHCKILPGEREKEKGREMVDRARDLSLNHP